jgi:hypothetical protein
MLVVLKRRKGYSGSVGMLVLQEQCNILKGKGLMEQISLQHKWYIAQSMSQTWGLKHVMDYLTSGYTFKSKRIKLLLC